MFRPPVHWASFCGVPLISCVTGDRPVWLQAVAALLQDDTSAIVTLESSGIDRPAKLDGCVYASYGARCGPGHFVARADPHVSRPQRPALKSQAGATQV